MQARKRAKPVKFGRSHEKPRITVSDKPGLENDSAGDEKPSSGTINNHTAHQEESEEKRAGAVITHHKSDYHLEETHITERHQEKEDIEILENEQESGASSEDQAAGMSDNENITSPIAKRRTLTPPMVENTHQAEAPQDSGISASSVDTQNIQNTSVPDSLTENSDNTAPPVVQNPVPPPVAVQSPVPPVAESYFGQSNQESELPPSVNEAQNLEPATLGGETYIVEKEVKKSMLGYFFLIAIISFIIGLVTMAGSKFFIPQSLIPVSIPFLSAGTTSTPTPEPTQVPIPTPKVVALSTYNIEILNGSGVTGAATKLKEILTDEGFKIIAIGNADNNEYTDTVIYSEKGTDPEFLSKLKKNLSKTYSIVDGTSKSPVATSDAEIIITIGSDAAKDSTQ